MLNTVLAQIAAGKPPTTILIGGTSDYLSEQAFRDLRDAAVAANPSISIEAYEPGAELATILDSYRTMSLFGSARLLIVPEVNAFVSAKELTSLFDKALAEWKSAKTDRKRAPAPAKLLHVLGLVGADLDMTDRQIADALGAAQDNTLTDMLAFCRNSGKKAGRGEGDGALRTQAIARRAGDAPADAHGRDPARLRDGRAHRPPRRRRRLRHHARELRGRARGGDQRARQRRRRPLRRPRHRRAARP